MAVRQIRDEKLTAIAAGFRSSRGTTKKLSLEEMAVLAAVKTGDGGPLQAKIAYPSHSEQIITPDEDYYGLVSVTVKPVPRLPAYVASVVGQSANFVETVVNIGVAVSVTATDYTT